MAELRAQLDAVRQELAAARSETQMGFESSGKLACEMDTRVTELSALKTTHRAFVEKHEMALAETASLKTQMKERD